LGISFDDSDIRKTLPKAILGYSPGEEIEMYKYEGKCSLDDGIIRHNFPTAGGADGGPFVVDTGSPMALGLHQGNYEKEGRALKFTTRIYERVNQWLNKKRGSLKLGTF
jgi:hypothetical protein